MKELSVFDKVKRKLELEKEINDSFLKYEEFNSMSWYFMHKFYKYDSAEYKVKNEIMTSALIFIFENSPIRDRNGFYKVLMNYNDAFQFLLNENLSVFSFNKSVNTFGFLTEITFAQSSEYENLINGFEEGFQKKELTKDFFIDFLRKA